MKRKEKPTRQIPKFHDDTTAMTIESEEQLIQATVNRGREFSFPRLIVVPLSSHAVDGVRKEKERLTAAEISSSTISSWITFF